MHTVCRNVKMIPYVNDSFTEEVLPQIQSCTFLSQLQGMAPSMIIYTEFKQGTISDSNEKAKVLLRYYMMDYILTCAQKLTSSQLYLPHGTKQKGMKKL